MDRIKIVSQIIGFIAFFISLIAFHRKDKKKIFQTMALSNLLECIHYILLGAYSGCATKAIALIRNIIISIKEKNKKLNSIIVLAIFIIGYIIAGILTYDGIFSLLPIITGTIYLVIVWNGDRLKVKKIAFLCSFLWFIYNIYVLSISGITLNVVEMVSLSIAIWNEKRAEKDK